MDNSKKFKPEDLYLGRLFTGSRLFTGNKYCFQGRIEIVGFKGNKIIVELTKEITNGTHSWCEEWEAKTTMQGLEIGEYYDLKFWPETFPIPKTIRGCFNQIEAHVLRTLTTDKPNHPKDIHFCYPLNNKTKNIMIIMLDKDNMYSKEMFIYKELIKGFLDKITLSYHMEYNFFENGTIIIYPKDNNTLIDK